jgi:uncharacterized protein (TIGR02421 family)
MKGTLRKTVKQEISDKFCKEIKSRLVEGKRIRRRLPYDGWLNIDRNLPFLFVYRRPTRKRDEGTQKLVKGEASYLVASGVTTLRPSLKKLIHSIVETESKHFNGFLIVEIWSNNVPEKTEIGPDLQGPEFRIITSTTRPPSQTVEAFQEALKRILVNRRTSSVKIIYDQDRSPAGLQPLISVSEARKMNCFVIGLEVSSMYRNQDTGEIYPLALRRLQLGLTGALKIAAFTFANHQTNMRPKHFQALGKRALVKSVWEVDRQLAEIDSMFNFLLLVTPVNVDQAWSLFKKYQFEKVPVFYYRLRPVDPAILKRKLYQVPIETIEDPVIANLLREKRGEINRKLTMLEDRNLPQFFHGSLQLYGGISDEMRMLAEKLLQKIKPHSHNGRKKEILDAEAFAVRVLNEFEIYKQQYPEMAAKVEIRDDIVGLMVVSGNLLISRNVAIPKSRVEALLQHEVGTHVLTYYNGKSQPFRQLFCGLPGYEELQEGLAVLAEYLVGGLSGPRLRLLAGRVMAAHLLIQKASFLETFQEMNRTYGFNKRTSFIITVRTYRGGGLTKDAIYLRGLVRLMDYLRNGGDLETLFIGKIAFEQVPVIQELQWRSVLHPAPLKPSYISNKEIKEKISILKNKKSVFDLI